MSCRDTIHLICMYLEGKLSAPVQVEIERHLTPALTVDWF